MGPWLIRLRLDSRTTGRNSLIRRISGLIRPIAPYPPAPPTNGLAIASLVCGVGTFVIGLSFIPAIICGHIARRQIRQTGEQGGGLALAGLILGYVGGALFIAAVLAILFLVAKVSSTVSVGNSVGVPGGIPAPANLPFPAPGN